MTTGSMPQRAGDGASRRSAIAPFHVMEVMRAAAEREAEGHRVLHLEVGQPSTPAPSTVRDAAHRAIDRDVLGYTTALGTSELRSAIADWYLRRHQVAVDPTSIIATTGASGSCVLAFLAAFDPGDRVGVFEPGYPCYRNDLRAFGIEAIGIPLSTENGYRPTTADLESAGPLRGLILASPSNPTGTVLDEAALGAMLDWCRRNDVIAIVDEIYHGIHYDTPAPSALEWVAANDATNVLVFNSFSKYWSMTGWRLGWIVAPPQLVEPIERLAQNLTIAPPTISQHAALAAFGDITECEANVRRYATNRQILLDRLPAIGLDRFAPPDGAFYFWVDVEPQLRPGEPGRSSASDLCATWLRELSVATTPGIDFDPVRGERFVRLSYAGSEADIAEALTRIAGWID